MKHFLVSLALAAVLAVPFGAQPTFAATTSMMPACAAGDPVVWVNTKSKVFHMQGDAYYGKTKSGKYACKSDAVAMGARASGMAASMKGMKKKKSAMEGSDTNGMSMSGMNMASPMPGRHHRKKKNGAMMQTSPNPLVPAPTPTPTQ